MRSIGTRLRGSIAKHFCLTRHPASQIPTLARRLWEAVNTLETIRSEADPFTRRFLNAVIAEDNGTRSQIGQDLFAALVSGNKIGGYFVEVGVGDGINDSNSWLLESQYEGLSGSSRPN